jgi:hypothetical protein
MKTRGLVLVLLTAGMLLSATSNGNAQSPKHHRVKKPQQHATPQNSPTYSAPDERGTEKMPFAVKLLNTGKSDKEAADETDQVRRENNAEWWMRVLTGALVGVGILQLFAFIAQAFALRKTVRESARQTIATQKAADAAKQSADVAQAALASSNQPWLVAENWTIKEPAEEDTTVANFELRNFGDGPAWLTNLELKFTKIDSGTRYSPDPDYKSERPNIHADIAGAALAPKESIKRMALYEGLFITPEVLRAYRRGETYLLVVGKIEFEDARGLPNEMRFSAQFQWSTDGKSTVFRDVGPSSYHVHGRRHTKPSKS